MFIQVALLWQSAVPSIHSSMSADAHVENLITSCFVHTYVHRLCTRINILKILSGVVGLHSGSPMWAFSNQHWDEVIVLQGDVH